jgi:hypothetical protein
MRLRETTISLLNVFIGAVEGILGLRFLLKLFGANSGNNFVSWIYSMSDGLLDPFRGIFPARVLENRYVLEFTTLFAMLMYGLIALLIMAAITAVTAPAVDRDTTVVKKRR